MVIFQISSRFASLKVIKHGYKYILLNTQQERELKSWAKIKVLNLRIIVCIKNLALNRMLSPIFVEQAKKCFGKKKHNFFALFLFVQRKEACIDLYLSVTQNIFSFQYSL